MKNCQFHNTLTVRTLLRVFMGSIQERRAFFGCDMNTFCVEKPSKSQILQPPHYQGHATSVHGEYPGKAGLFWVRHEHFFERKRIEIANFITRSLPAGCYHCSWGARDIWLQTSA